MVCEGPFGEVNCGYVKTRNSGQQAVVFGQDFHSPQVVLLAGFWSDALVRKGHSNEVARKTPVLVGMFLSIFIVLPVT